MSKLYIHAGNHKTGTSSIQNFLHKYREFLSKEGLDVYMQDSVDGKKFGNLHWWFDEKSVHLKGADILPEFCENLSNFYKGKDVIASSECFSWIFKKSIIEKLKKGLEKTYSDIKVVFYIRRQDLHAVSHYQQATRTYPDKKFFEGDYRGLPYITPNSCKYLDYNDRIGAWGDVFGDDNIIVKVFDKKNFPEESVIYDLMSHIGINLPSPIDIPDANASQGWESTKIRHLMWEVGVGPQSDLSKAITRKLNNEGKLLPSRDSAKEFYNHFKSSNSLLNDRFGISDNPFIFDDSFDVYPSEEADTWSEASANDAIKKILKAVKDFYR